MHRKADTAKYNISGEMAPLTQLLSKLFSTTWSTSKMSPPRPQLLIVPEEVNLEHSSTVQPTKTELSQNNDYKSITSESTILASKQQQRLTNASQLSSNTPSSIR